MNVKCMLMCFVLMHGMNSLLVIFFCVCFVLLLLLCSPVGVKAMRASGVFLCASFPGMPVSSLLGCIKGNRPAVNVEQSCCCVSRGRAAEQLQDMHFPIIATSHCI